MTKSLLRVLALSCALMAATGARADEPYPTRPVTLVVQAASGGGNDALARRFAEQLQKKLGQPVVVENRGGAGGAIGADAVARAVPDGYTLLLITAGETYYKALNPGVKFDVEKDFTPVTLLANAPLVLVANARLPAKTFAEFVAYAKGKPGTLSYGTPGVGSPHHLAGEMLRQAAGIDLVHVPYRGTGPAVQDLVAGQIQLAWSSPAAIAQHIQAGTLRALAVADSRRLSTLPAVPTIAESGYPDVRFDNWFGIAGPKDLPVAIVERLNAVLLDIGRETAFASGISALGFQPILAGPKEFKERIHADHVRYTRIAESVKAK